MITNMVPPFGAALVFGMHVVQTNKVDNLEYAPPRASWVTLLWGFKILAPLLSE